MLLESDFKMLLNHGSSELTPPSAKLSFTLVINAMVVALMLATIAASSLASGADLTPESLAMARQRIVLSDTSLRAASPYGAASPRDWTVCGVKRLLFPPAVLTDYRFGLAFREHATNTIILDNQDEYEDPLYLNQNRKDSKILLSQTAHWQPNLYTRTGTFHQYLKGRLISFGIKSQLSVSAQANEVFLELDIFNRGKKTLTLTLIPDQRWARAFRPDTVSQPLEQTLRPEQPKGHSRPPCFVLRNQSWQIAVASDLKLYGDAGWRLEVPSNAHRKARFSLSLSPGAKEKAPAPPRQLTELETRIGRAQKAVRQNLAWAGQQLPSVQTTSTAFDEFYARSILTLMMCRLDRPEYVTRPFYEYGRMYGYSLLWDSAFAAGGIAMLEPKAVKEKVEAHLKAGIYETTYMSWNGTGGHWYAQSPFALLRTIRAYLDQTGDIDWLDEKIGDASLYEHLCKIGLELHRRYARPDGLLDFGEGAGAMLEIRTSGYDHVVASSNGMASDYFTQLAEWGRIRKDPRASKFESWGRQIAGEMQKQLWDEEAGWFLNLFPDGSRHRVMSYHVFVLLGMSSLKPQQSQRLVAHISEGEFLGPFGFYSIAHSDSIHFDREDCDWGGGGQYLGMATRIAESLYRLGERHVAWDVMKRCIRWTERLPYWPQTLYADELALQPHQVDWPLQIAGAGGVQAVVYGVFGIRPHSDGTLEIQPSCEADLGDASLKGYRFRGRVYDVTMSAGGFVVSEQGREIASGKPGEKVFCGQKQT